jgi:hypothetical protein
MPALRPNDTHRESLFAVVPYGVLWADGEGVIRSRYLVVAFRLLKEIDVTFVVVILQQLRRFVEADTARRACVIDVPWARNVLREFVCIVSHGALGISEIRPQGNALIASEA